MDRIFENLPVPVKATVLRLYDSKTKECFHLFSVFELLEKGMDVTPDDMYAAKGNQVDNKKVYFTVSDFMMTEGFIKDPLSNYILPDQKRNPDRFLFFNKEFLSLPALVTKGGKDSDKKNRNKFSRIRRHGAVANSESDLGLIAQTDDESFYVPMNNTLHSALRKVLPNPGYVCWVRAYMDVKERTLAFLKDNPAFMKQLSEVSLKKMGFDLMEFPEYVGGIILVGYHPQIRRFHIKAVETPAPGILFGVELHSDISAPPLRVDVTLIEQGDCIRAETSQTFPTPGESQFMPLPSFPNQPIIRIFDIGQDGKGKDKGGNLIFYSKNTFLDGAFLTFSIPSRVLSGISIEKPNGSIDTLPDIQKVEREMSSIGGRDNHGARYLAEKVFLRSHRQLRTQGSFIFFNGDRNQRQKNREEAREIVRNLLNKATKRCYICDDYFDAKDFGEYIVKLSHDDVEIRVLSGYNEIGEESARRLAKASDVYNEAVGKKITICKMLMGKSSVLHDRFLIVDDDIWAVGASFNELGARASVIYKIPKGADTLIIDEIEKWWNNPEISRDVHDFPEIRKCYFRLILNWLKNTLKKLRDGL